MSNLTRPPARAPRQQDEEQRPEDQPSRFPYRRRGVVAHQDVRQRLVLTIRETSARKSRRRTSRAACSCWNALACRSGLATWRGGETGRPWSRRPWPRPDPSEMLEQPASRRRRRSSGAASSGLRRRWRWSVSSSAVPAPAGLQLSAGRVGAPCRCRGLQPPDLDQASRRPRPWEQLRRTRSCGHRHAVASPQRDGPWR